MKQQKILIIDDDKDNCNKLCELLAKSLPIRTIALNSAKKAIDHIGLNKYDVYIIDLAMRNISGPEFYFELRRQDLENLKKLLFLVPMHIGDDLLRFLHFSQAPCIHQPINHEDVLKIVRSMLNFSV
ncbi:MAG: response regulator [Candidatus Alcyoniella australis]|nr:response regulator [Candidatus Alcyoniella australis]